LNITFKDFSIKLKNITNRIRITNKTGYLGYRDNLIMNNITKYIYITSKILTLRYTLRVYDQSHPEYKRIIELFNWGQ
jgi:hypothetical protein